MDDINMLSNINFYLVFSGFLIGLFALKAIISIIEWFCVKFGIETKYMRRKREDHELLMETANGLKNLNDDREQDLKNIHEDNIVWREHSVKVQEKYDERFKKLDKLKEQNERFIENEKTKKQQIDYLTLALKELLAAKINEKYKYYISIHGIPEDEVDEFTSLHFAYKGCGGNHHGDAKYNYVMENLPVIPVETKLVY